MSCKKGKGKPQVGYIQGKYQFKVIDTNGDIKTDPESITSKDSFIFERKGKVWLFLTPDNNPRLVPFQNQQDVKEYMSEKNTQIRGDILKTRGMANFTGNIKIDKIETILNNVKPYNTYDPPSDFYDFTSTKRGRKGKLEIAQQKTAIDMAKIQEQKAQLQEQKAQFQEKELKKKEKKPKIKHEDIVKEAEDPFKALDPLQQGNEPPQAQANPKEELMKQGEKEDDVDVVIEEGAPSPDIPDEGNKQYDADYFQQMEDVLQIAEQALKDKQKTLEDAQLQYSISSTSPLNIAVSLSKQGSIIQPEKIGEIIDINNEVQDMMENGEKKEVIAAKINLMGEKIKQLYVKKRVGNDIMSNSSIIKQIRKLRI